MKSPVETRLTKPFRCVMQLFPFQHIEPILKLTGKFKWNRKLDEFSKQMTIFMNVIWHCSMALSLFKTKIILKFIRRISLH